MGLFVTDSFLTFSALLSLRGTGHCGLPGFQVTWLSLCGVSGPWCALFEPSEHLWWVWGLILNMISPLLLSFWGFSFALGCGVSFFGGTQHSPVDGCSAASCNFGVQAGLDKHTSFYSAILESSWGGGEKPPIVWVQLRGQLAVISFPWSPPTITQV